jgi:hypothetical protein
LSDIRTLTTTTEQPPPSSHHRAATTEVSLAPIALRVGGPASVRMIGETLLDLTKWFP